MKDMKDKENYLDFFDKEEKAVQHAMWLNFKYRIAKIKFGVIDGPDNNYAVLEEATSEELEMPFQYSLPKNLSMISYDEMRHIKMDKDPLPHWEKIIGMISTMNGEILRYILHAKIPLKRLIRHELASRGYDENHRWCGFERAEGIWLV